MYWERFVVAFVPKENNADPEENKVLRALNAVALNIPRSLLNAHLQGTRLKYMNQSLQELATILDAERTRRYDPDWRYSLVRTDESKFDSGRLKLNLGLRLDWKHGGVRHGLIFCSELTAWVLDQVKSSTVVRAGLKRALRSHIEEVKKQLEQMEKSLEEGGEFKHY